MIFKFYHRIKYYKKTMPTVIQNFREEITSELRNLKTDKDKDRAIINTLLKMIQCSTYDVYNNNVDVVFFKKSRSQ